MKISLTSKIIDRIVAEVGMAKVDIEDFVENAVVKELEYVDELNNTNLNEYAEEKKRGGT